MEPDAVGQSDLNEFLQFLFEGLDGWAYVASKNPSDDTDWKQFYYQVPAQMPDLTAVILQETPTREVYLAPALYSERDARRETFKVTNVVWTEFDGNAPLPESYSNPPSVRVQSSNAGHEHVYWKLSSPITNPDDLEKVNRDIAYALSADSSAWDATQILRPPSTRNHKRGAAVGILSDNQTIYDLHIFENLPTSPEPISAEGWEPNNLPDVAQVILKYAFPENIAKLFSKPKLENGTRSTGLMELAYACCEMGMHDNEIFAVILNADNRWEKFSKRKDQFKRLAHIITVARHKHPGTNESGDPFDEPIFIFDFVDFINTKIEIDWAVEGMLMEGGSMLVVGPSGIGKTQVSTRFAMHLALGKDYWHYKIPKAKKIVLLSLEMGHAELQYMVNPMTKGLSASDLQGLKDNLFIVPHGEKWALNTPVGQEKLMRLIEEIEPDGIMIDSVGNAIRGNISKDEDVFPLVEFNYHIRKKYDVFLWYIHHMRKSNNGGHAPSTADDIYGNQYLLNSATSSYGLLRGRDGLIKVRNFKQRLAKQEDDYYIQRQSETLEFKKINQEVDKVVQHLVYTKPEEEKGPQESGGKFNL